jgi:uncharacterized protein YegP (UPF0339 family)
MRVTLFFDIRNGETRYRWRLCSADSETVDWSENAYAEKAECQADIELMKKGCPPAQVVDLAVARI